MVSVDNAMVPVKQSDEMVALIKESFCKDATDAELKLFLAQAERLGLDPVARQIYSVSRWSQRDNKMVRTTQVSIDGFRLIAERSGAYAGQLGPFWCDADGEWKDVWLGTKPPVAARVGVMKATFKEPLWATAKWTSYAPLDHNGSVDPKKGRFWLQMPDVMLAKVAEALALRRAFPAQLSGVYAPEEMDQADHVPAKVIPLKLPDVKAIKAPVEYVDAEIAHQPSAQPADCPVRPPVAEAAPPAPPCDEAPAPKSPAIDAAAIAEASKLRKDYYRLLKQADVHEAVAGGFGKAVAQKSTSNKFTKGDWDNIFEQLNLRIDMIRYGCRESSKLPWGEPWHEGGMRIARDALARQMELEERR